MSNTANQNPPQGARAIPPRPVPDYDSERRKHLEEHEGIARRIYSDPKGIPSMGLGHALAIQKGDGSYALRSLDDIGKEISGDENRPYKFSKEEEKRLRDVEGLLNGKMPDPDPEKYGKDKAYTAQYDETKRLVESNIKTRQAEIKKIIPPYAKQDETPDKNKFGFTLRDDRIQALSEKAWKEHQDNVWTLVEAEAKRRGWSKDEIDSYKNAFKGSWEEMMLASLRFNNVRSPEAIKALLDGDRAKFRAEIEFRSNKETEENEDVRRGLARRRRDEAEKAAPLKSLGEAEQKLWAALVAEYWAYRKEFADLYGLGTPHLVQPGETLESIAKKNGCTVDELKDLNGIDDLTKKVGKTIFIPTDAYRTEKAARQETAAGPSPEADKLLAMMGQPLAEPAQEILLKDPALWTENEVRTVMEGEDYQGTNGAAERQEAFNRVAEWFRLTYGDGRARLDAAGRPLPSIPVRQAPREPAPARTPQGENVGDAARSVALRVARAASGDGLESAVRTLQGGLNRFVPRQRGTPDLLEDGDYGPKTHATLTRTVAKEGAAATKNAFDLQRMLGGLRKSGENGLSDGTGERLRGILGDAFGGRDDEGVEGTAMQNLLNDVRVRTQNLCRLRRSGLVRPDRRKAQAVAGTTAKPFDASGGSETARPFGLVAKQPPGVSPPLVDVPHRLRDGSYQCISWQPTQFARNYGA